MPNAVTNHNDGPSAYIGYTTTGQPLPTGEFANVATRNFDKEVFGTTWQYQKTGWSNDSFVAEVQHRYSKLMYLAVGTVDLGRDRCRICGNGGVYPGEETPGVNRNGVGQVNFQSSQHRNGRRGRPPNRLTCGTVDFIVDVERAIEHLLDLHARAEARMDRAEIRMDKADARMDRFEKQLTATANLVRAGMKIVIANAKTLDRLVVTVGQLQNTVSGLVVTVGQLENTVGRLDKKVDRLDKKFDRLIDILAAQNRNGRRRSRT